MKHTLFKLEHRYAFLDEKLFLYSHLSLPVLSAIIHNVAWTVHDYLEDNEPYGDFFGSDVTAFFITFFKRYGVARPWQGVNQEPLISCPSIDCYEVFHQYNGRALTRWKARRRLKRLNVHEPALMQLFYSIPTPTQGICGSLEFCFLHDKPRA